MRNRLPFLAGVMVVLVACGQPAPTATPTAAPASPSAGGSSKPSQFPAPAKGLAGKIVMNIGSDGHLWMMNADGSDLRQLTSAPGIDFDPSWLSDGRRVVFRTSRGQFRVDSQGIGAEGIVIPPPIRRLRARNDSPCTEPHHSPC
jgi:hypothetical protein